MTAQNTLSQPTARKGSDSFLITVKGDSMLGAGIRSGDILVVDRAAEPEEGKIVVASINNKLAVKRLAYTDEGVQLLSENPAFTPLRVSSEDKFEIWGVVKMSVRDA